MKPARSAPTRLLKPSRRGFDQIRIVKIVNGYDQAFLSGLGVLYYLHALAEPSKASSTPLEKELRRHKLVDGTFGRPNRDLLALKQALGD